MNFMFMMYFASAFGILTKMLVPALFVGLGEYLICTKTKGKYIKWILPIICLIFALVMILSYSWMMNQTIATQYTYIFIYGLLLFLSFGFPCWISLIVLWICSRYKKKNDVNRMRISDLWFDKLSNLSFEIMNHMFYTILEKDGTYDSFFSVFIGACFSD